MSVRAVKRQENQHNRQRCNGLPEQVTLQVGCDKLATKVIVAACVPTANAGTPEYCDSNLVCRRLARGPPATADSVRGELVTPYRIPQSAVGEVETPYARQNDRLRPLPRVLSNEQAGITRRDNEVCSRGSPVVISSKSVGATETEISLSVGFTITRPPVNGRENVPGPYRSGSQACSGAPRSTSYSRSHQS